MTLTDPDGHACSNGGHWCLGEWFKGAKAKVSLQMHSVFNKSVSLAGQSSGADGVQATGSIGNASAELKAGRGGVKGSASASGMKTVLKTSDPAGVSEGTVTLKGFSAEAKASAEATTNGAEMSGKVGATVFSAKGELRIGNFFVSSQFNAIGLGGEASLTATSSDVHLSVGATVLVGGNLAIGYRDLQAGVSDDEK